MSTELPPLDLIRLDEAYKAGGLTPLRLVDAILADIEARGQDGVWLSVVDPELLRARAAELAERHGVSRMTARQALSLLESLTPSSADR